MTRLRSRIRAKTQFSNRLRAVRHTEFGGCDTSGSGQAPKCFVATLGAFKDSAGDVPTSLVFLGSG
jgi:hypothetical protein